MNAMDSLIFRCIFLANITAAICRTIINQNDFHVGIDLFANGIDALGNIELHIVNSNND